MPKDELFSSEEQNVLVDHAKMILKQTWSTYPITHSLKEHGWHNLPSHEHELARTPA